MYVCNVFMYVCLIVFLCLSIFLFLSSSVLTFSYLSFFPLSFFLSLYLFEVRKNIFLTQYCTSYLISMSSSCTTAQKLGTIRIFSFFAAAKNSFMGIGDNVRSLVFTMRNTKISVFTDVTPYSLENVTNLWMNLLLPSSGQEMDVVVFPKRW